MESDVIIDGWLHKKSKATCSGRALHCTHAICCGALECAQVPPCTTLAATTAGDYRKEWRQRYFVVYGGDQPKIVYYRDWRVSALSAHKAALLNRTHRPPGTMRLQLPASKVCITT